MNSDKTEFILLYPHWLKTITVKIHSINGQIVMRINMTNYLSADRSEQLTFKEMKVQNSHDAIKKMRAHNAAKTITLGHSH